MSIWKVIRKKSVGNGLKACLAMLLLVLYFVGSTRIESLHTLFHSHDTVAHAIQQEKDPCHRTIYHQEKKDGCEHNSHLVKAQKCSLCHALSHSDEISFAGLSDEPVQSRFAIVEKFISVQLTATDNNLPSRAPPII